LNVYIETNFVLELAFLQEQGSSCKEILRLAEAGEIRLVLPAYCLTESHETLGRRHRNREKMRLDLERELRQLSRTAHLQTRIGDFRQIKDLLIDSSAEEKVRLEGFQTRLLEAASLIPLETTVLLAAPSYQRQHGLSPQDSFVYASVQAHLQQSEPAPSCFLTRDAIGFDDPDIVQSLRRQNCKLLVRFDDGLGYVRSSLR
jgi:predicted nucleic acid-binding protein